ncbi:MAG: sulfatase [Bacteroidota bacterium]
MWRVSLLLIAAFGLIGCEPAAPPPPPNIVFILADDLGYTDVGAYNPDTFYETPHLDRLAAEGLLFTDGYAAAPVCSPTRASLQTGKYPARMRTTDWFGAPQPETVQNHRTRDKPLLPAPYVATLSHEETTIAEALQESGYRTFFAGKWHLGNEGSYPEDHGYQINKGGFERGGPYGGDRYFSPYGNPRLDDGPPGEHLPARLGQETAAFIASSTDAPFFAMLSFYSVHTPLMTRADLQAKYEAKPAPEDAWGQEGDRRVRLVQNHAVYAGMVEAMDEAIGTVMAALDSLGLAENTLVVFTSDNGGLSTSEGHPTSNLPLRGGKGWLYEGGIRQPFIARWPSRIQAGQTTATPVTSPDLYPTFLAAAGLDAHPDQPPDGVNLLPRFEGQSLDRDALYWHYPHYGNQGGTPGAAIRDGDWKLIQFFEDDRVELFNLVDDIGEKTNMAEAELERVQAMVKQLQTWQESVGAAFPSPNPNAAE